VALVTSDSLLTFTAGGSSLMSVKHGYLLPCIDAAGSRLVLYSARSRDISVYNRSKQLVSFKTQYSIVDAAISAEGTLVILTESERYPCQMEVYRNGRYEKALTLLIANGFPMGVYISDNGTHAVAVRLRTEGGELHSLMSVLDIRSEQIIYEQQVAGIALQAYFIGGVLFVITDTGIYRLSADGSIESSRMFTGLPVLAITFDGIQNIAVAFGDNTQSSINYVSVYSRTLEERGHIALGAKLSDMFMSGERIYLLSDGCIEEYDYNGTARRTFETPQNTCSIIYIDGIVAVLPDRMIRITKPMEDQ